MRGASGCFREFFTQGGEVDVQSAQHGGSDAATEADEAQQKMIAGDDRHALPCSLFIGEEQCLLRAWCEVWTVL